MCCSELEALLGALPAIELAGGATSVSAHRCLAVRACACACVRVCVCACVFACVCNRHANERGAQTNLPEPVRSAAVQMSYFWDRQKEKVAMQCGPLTHFIPKPAMDVWERAKDRFGDIVAQGPCACACIIQTCWIPLPMHLRPTCMHARAHTHTCTHTDRWRAPERAWLPGVFRLSRAGDRRAPAGAGLSASFSQHLHYCNLCVSDTSAALLRAQTQREKDRLGHRLEEMNRVAERRLQVLDDQLNAVTPALKRLLSSPPVTSPPAPPAAAPPSGPGAPCSK